MEDLIVLSKKIGFTAAAILRRPQLEYRPEVRDMCAMNLCGVYGKSWICPPACGSLDEICKKAERFMDGLLVQTTVQLEDSFDYERMQAGMQKHQKQLEALVDRCRNMGMEILPMGAGGCTRCENCTYPAAPCRFPDKAFSSMEAYGLLVNDVCRQAGLGYYYGSNTLTYSALLLVHKNSETKQGSHE